MVPLDVRDLIERASNLIRDKDFGSAEALLTEARQRATSVGDPQAQGLILSELIELYCLTEPARLREAERLALERENLMGDASSMLQTAMLFCHSLHDYSRTATKLRETIDKAAAEGDIRTAYTSLGLLGHALLQLDRKSEAVVVLKEIEQMVLANKAVVVGDETLFLEGARAQGLEVPTIKRLASTLAPLCRDPEFRGRLKALANNAS